MLAWSIQGLLPARACLPAPGQAPQRRPRRLQQAARATGAHDAQAGGAEPLPSSSGSDSDVASSQQQQQQPRHGRTRPRRSANKLGAAPTQIAAGSVRSQYNPSSLAFLGDAVWETYIRQHFYGTGRQTLHAYNAAVQRHANAQAQAACYEWLIARAQSPPLANDAARSPPGTPREGRGEAGHGQASAAEGGGPHLWSPCGAPGPSDPPATASHTSPGTAGTAMPVPACERDPEQPSSAAAPAADLAASLGHHHDRDPSSPSRRLGGLVVHSGEQPHERAAESALESATARGGFAPPSDSPTSAPTSSSFSSSSSSSSPAAAPASVPAPPPVPHSDRQAQQPFVLRAEEQQVLRWAVNSSLISAPRGMDSLQYKKATALEVLVAYLYLTDLDRCLEVMGRLVLLS